MDVKETLIDCNFLSQSSSVSALGAQSARKLLAFVDVAFASHAFGKDPWSEHSYAVNEDVQHENVPDYDHNYMSRTRENDHSYSTVGKTERSKALDFKEKEKTEVPCLQRRASTGSESHLFAEEEILTSSDNTTKSNPCFHDSCFALRSRHCFSLEMIHNIDIACKKKDLTLGLSDPDISRIVLDGQPTRPAVLPQQMDTHSAFDHSYAVTNLTTSTMSLNPKSLENVTETKVPDEGSPGGQIWNNTEISPNEFLKSPFLDHSYQLVERKRFKIKNSFAQSPFLDHSYQSVKMQNLRNFQNAGTKRDGCEDVSNAPIRSPYFDHSYDRLLTFVPNSPDLGKNEPSKEPLYLDHSYETKNREFIGVSKGTFGLQPSISCKTDHSYFISDSPTDSGTGSNLEDENDIEMNLLQFHKDHTYTTRDTL
ncbi:hypothetical protein CHS0354_041907 [Potamilus streckersoni]|uniref:Uncharacterized protein n=1 Tax=Potamilus streckersoni TaxID=2493646 RepID=A0AAE0SSV1_9BIVA|nr:hypothetical protein CHS0354_041907 [Potamilus streckersoni]